MHPEHSETRSDSSDRSSIALTLYNDELALICETRKLPLHEGLNRVALRDVSARIKPETASIRAHDAELRLLEQNFDYDLLSDTALLAKHIGKRVTTIRTNPATGEETREDATVLANNGSVVLQYADRIETGLPANIRLAYHDVPASLRDRPTLTIDLNSDRAGEQQLDLAYLSTGFSWRADYVATLTDDEQSLNLAGWVTLNNQSGSTYENATLQLVAGDVARVEEDDDDEPLAGSAPILYAAAMPSDMAEESLFEYHLYTLARPTTLKHKQQKQIALLSAAHVPTEKEYRLENDPYRYHSLHNCTLPEVGDTRKVAVYLTYQNREADGLGLPLPKGIVRVYKNDRNGQPQFIGEDRINHTAKNDCILLKLGSAFDIKGEWQMTDLQYLEAGEWKSRRRGKPSKFSIIKEYLLICRVTLKNAKDKAVTVTVVEPIPGDWRIQEETHPHEKVEANHARWRVPVPADGSTTLQYTVHLKL